MNSQLIEKASIYGFSVFRIEMAERRLWRADEQIPLTPKQFDLLAYFVENAGRIAKKSDLLEAVWADAYVEEATLARNVSWLRNKLEEHTGGESLIETVPKLGYRFTAEVTRCDENTPIAAEQTVPNVPDEKTIPFDYAVTATDEAEKTGKQEAKKTNSFSPHTVLSRRFLFAMTFLFIGMALVVIVGMSSTLYRNNYNAIQPATESKDQPGNILNVSSDGNTQHGVTEIAPIKIGSVVHLRNQNSNEAGYLDAWGLVRNKPEFQLVPSETMFVSTHPNPNRDNGSGSWKIVSATGKREGEMLVYGDKIHLRNMYPDAGYLDNCGWLKHLPVYQNFAGAAKFAVFTTFSQNRDNGTGVWIIGSDAKYQGNPVLEGDGIVLENGFSDGDFLNTTGRVSDLPAFNDYDGSLLVFIHAQPAGRHPNSGIWIISSSKAAPN